MTQIEFAKRGKITSQIREVAKKEGISAEFIKRKVAKGEIVIPLNKSKIKNQKSKIKMVGIGKGLKTKVNANIGTSPDLADIKKEKRKLEIAIKTGADTVMDLSCGGNIKKMRKMVLENSSLPVGTVPIYEAVCNTAKKGKEMYRIDKNEIFDVIEKQCEDGIDFITVHCGVTKKVIEILKKNRRIGGIVSRGGSFLARWIKENRKENPLYEDFSRLLNIAYKYDVTLSLGDGLRPGALADSTDKLQIEELKVLGELAKIAKKKNVQVIIEGPGHIPLNEIAKNVKLEKKYCQNAPFYVLGPIVSDVAPGYDHVTSAIGGAIAGASGADFLCYVTPSEHLHLPSVKDVKEGVIATRIAAHSADLAKGARGALDWDREISKARRKLDWKKMEKLSINPEEFRKRRKKAKTKECTMCSEFCAIKQF